MPHRRSRRLTESFVVPSAALQHILRTSFAVPSHRREKPSSLPFKASLTFLRSLFRRQIRHRSVPNLCFPQRAPTEKASRSVLVVPSLPRRRQIPTHITYRERTMTNPTNGVEEISTTQDMENMIETGDRVIVNFHAPWAAPCAQMNEVFAELNQQYGKVRFATVSAELLPELTGRYAVSTVPTFLMFGGCRLVRRQDGANALKLCGHIEWLSKASERELEDGACEMIAKKGEVTVVMKGNADRPRCAFSGQVVKEMRKAGVVFKSVDVLEDGFMREEMKRWAGWKTYPMVFVGGKFVGGVEEVRKMAVEGKLVESLEKAIVEPAVRRTARREVVDEGERVRRRMEGLTKLDKVVVFMKGGKDAPKCKYSKRVVALLKEQGVAFESVDVLRDDEARQGMKVYSDWPTFPQVYGGGIFVGGVDVVQELAGTGDLKRELGLERA